MRLRGRSTMGCMDRAKRTLYKRGMSMEQGRMIVRDRIERERENEEQ